MMVNHIAQEALIQRGRSPLYLDLISFYQDSQKALTELPKPSHQDIVLTLKSINFKDRLKAIVLKHMNLMLSNVIIVEEDNIELMFIISWTQKAYRRASEIDHTNEGIEIQRFNRHYDDKIGMLGKEFDWSKAPFNFDMNLWTGLWRMKNDDGSFYLTAEELAAGTLHELGHGNYLVQNFFVIYHRTKDISDYITYSDRIVDKEIILKIIEAVAKSKYLTSDDRKIVANVKTYFQENNAANDPYYWEALSVLTTSVAAEDASFILGIVNGKVLNAFGDRVRSDAQIVQEERLADDFSARHGAYQALISMVGKSWSSVEDKSNLYFKISTSNTLAIILGSFDYFTSVFNMRPEEVAMGYDPLMRRFELIVQTAKHAFHDPSLPDNIKRDIQEQIEASERYIADYKSATHRRIRAQFKQWKDNSAKLGRIIASPFYDRLSADYGRLHNATRDLSHHSLYYLANKR